LSCRRPLLDHAHEKDPKTEEQDEGQNPGGIDHVTFHPSTQAVDFQLRSGRTRTTVYPVDQSAYELQQLLEEKGVAFEAKRTGSSAWWSIPPGFCRTNASASLKRRLSDEPFESPVSVWAPSQISAAMIAAGKIQLRENLFTQDHAGRGSFAITALTLRRMSASS
jgi:hypothetical protein